MTVAEMHDEFRIEYDNIDSFSNPEYTPEEIDYFLNSAQTALIDLAADKEGFEKTQSLRDMLGNITLNFSTSTFVTNAANETNGVFVELPSDYRVALKESVTVTFDDCNDVEVTKKIKVVPTTHDRLNVTFDNPFKKANKHERVLSVPFGSLTPNIQTVELITDGTFTITTYHLRYIKQPVEIDFNGGIDCELSEKAQEWIIKEAVLMAFKATNQLQKVQLLKQLDKQ